MICTGCTLYPLVKRNRRNAMKVMLLSEAALMVTHWDPRFA